MSNNDIVYDLQTIHKFLNKNANNLSEIADKSINLIVTSPPYPMVEMWDEIFINQDASIANDFKDGNSEIAFEKMHTILDAIWEECNRVLAEGCFVCINIGDATRTINGKFQLFSNHSRIIQKFLEMDYTVLPDIHWHKPTNSPNKFMGSGMYPAGAYVTYEHEYILIFRKGNKRQFNNETKIRRQESAYFWEERNKWFSDLWDVKGTKQKIGKNADRIRNGSYPVEIPYRLINMYSIYEDTVLDPFAGLGTTSIAAMLVGRNSISIDVSADMIELSKQRILEISAEKHFQEVIQERVKNHLLFIENSSGDKKYYINKTHLFKVKTKQEVNLKLYNINSIYKDIDNICCDYFLYVNKNME